MSAGHVTLGAMRPPEPRSPKTPDRPTLDPDLVTRARGAMLGLVAGNQLGVPTEGLGTPQAIRASFPSGVWDLAPPPKGSPYDDDAAMMLLLAESLVSRGGFDAQDVAERWVRWMKADGRGWGTPPGARCGSSSGAPSRSRRAGWRAKRIRRRPPGTAA